jgi:serine/threonine protein kinase
MVRSNSRKDLKKKNEPQHINQDSSLKEIDEAEIKKNSKNFETHLDGEIEKLSDITHE